MDKVFYAELTPCEFSERLSAAPIAYLPLGTLEWHGEHLPLGADGLQSQGFFAHLAQQAGGIVLPMLFLGPDLWQTVGDQTYYGMDVVGFRSAPPQQLTGSAYWADDDLFVKLLEQILGNLARAGFKVVVAHGHGPSTNTFKKHIPQWSERFGLKLFHCWVSEEESQRYPDLGVQTDHAAANETSLTMALRPDLVQMANLPTDLNTPLRAVAGKDPRTHASPEVGQEIIHLNGDRMATLLRAALK